MPIQTNYSFVLDYPIAGQDQPTYNDYTLTGVVHTNSPVGIVPGTAVEAALPNADGQGIKAGYHRYQRANIQLPGATPALAGAAFYGIVKYDLTERVEAGSQAFHTDINDTTSRIDYAAGQDISIKQTGRIWVLLAADFNSALISSPAYYVPSGANAGRITNVAAGNTAIAGGTLIMPALTSYNGDFVALLKLA